MKILFNIYNSYWDEIFKGRGELINTMAVATSGGLFGSSSTEIMAIIKINEDIYHKQNKIYSKNKLIKCSLSDIQENK